MSKFTDPRAAGLEWRHVAAVTIGNALEFYDFLIYAFFSIQIGHAFFPVQSAYGSLMLSLATFGAGFLTRPLGAFVIGNYADRVGRRPAMMLCFLLIGGAIAGMALIPSYQQIGIAAPILAIAARMVQGFSLGGEVGSNTAFLLEAAPVHQRGMIVSWQAASQNLALIAGSLCGVALTAVLPPGALEAYGWRIAFLTGAVAVPVGLWMRSGLPETLHAADSGAQKAVAPPSRLRLAITHGRVILLTLAMYGASTTAQYIFIYIVTYAQATLHMSARAGFLASTGGYGLSVVSSLLGGWLSDRWGRRPINVWSNFVLLLLIYPTFAWITSTRSEFALIAGITILMGTFSFGMGSLYVTLAESLPQAIRGSGFGLVYALAIALFGSITQPVATWLIHVTGNPLAPAWYMMAATALGQFARMAVAESAPVGTAAASRPAAALQR